MLSWSRIDCLNELMVSGVWERVGTLDRAAETDLVGGAEVVDSSPSSV